MQNVSPVHRNPNVPGPAHELLGGHPDITLIDPLPCVPFVDQMRRSHLIISDSGGIQREAPSPGKPVLVLREKTERPEAVEAGTVKLWALRYAASEGRDRTTDGDRYPR